MRAVPLDTVPGDLLLTALLRQAPNEMSTDPSFAIGPSPRKREG